MLIHEKTKYKIDEYVGLSWQPTSEIEFFIYNIRKIIEFRSGIILHEYKLARKNQRTQELSFTSWIEEDRLFKVDQNF